VLPKRWYPPPRLHGVTSQTTTLRILTSMKTSNLSILFFHARLYFGLKPIHLLTLRGEVNQFGALGTIKMELEELKCKIVQWIQLVQDRTQCWAVVNMAVKLRVPKRGEFLNQRSDY
jgi:hypothetical protein